MQRVRNLLIEERIRKNFALNHRLNINVYGGMGMDGDSPAVLKEKREDLEYIKQHPELYKKPQGNFFIGKKNES